jgi:ADP-ribosyl-[dinitrogen reductase] hydrolase
MPDAPKPHDTLSWLDLLLREERIALTRGPLLDTTPAAVHLRRDRIEGMLLGLAIGDALGNTTEGLTPGARAERFGEVRDYLPNPQAGGRPVGTPTDDTQLAFWTLERLIADGR